MKRIIKEYHSFLKERFKGDIATLVVELIYVLFCIGSAIYFAVQGKLGNTMLSLVFPLIVLLMCLLEWKIKFRGGALFYLIFFSMCTSNILGNGYELYFIFAPYFDKVMHTLSGIAFACLGYMLMKLMVGGDDGKKFWYCLLFSLAFAMAAAAIWEVYEYFCTAVLHNDLQSDYIISTIDYEKYISQTIIYYTDGTTEIIEDGFLDIGMFDTLQDMTVCLVGSLVTIGLLILDRFCFKNVINKLLVPKLVSSETRSDKPAAEVVEVKC